MNERPGIWRLTEVELRKAVDTRAGRWLIGVIAGLAVVSVGVALAVAKPADNTLDSLLTFSQLPASVLLPVVSILAVTSEWSQRTALGTFTLVPARGRVITAKATAVGLLALASSVVSVLVAAAAFGLGGALGRTGGGWDLKISSLALLPVVQGLNLAMGTALGLLLLTSAPAIVAFFVVPVALTAVGALVPDLKRAAAWLDLDVATIPLDQGTVSGQEWLHLLTATALWVGLPAIAGIWRIRRAEI